MKRLTLPLLVACLAATTSLGGCLDPYRAHVPAELVRAGWDVETQGVEGSLWKGKVTETTYTFDNQDGPPFPAFLQVFSIRQLSRASIDELLDLTERVIEDSARIHGINLDQGQSARGERDLASGASTRWFVRGGTLQGGGFFGAGTAGEEVKILGEAWHDGKSRTSVVAVAFAQVTQESTILFQPDVHDQTTWVRMVGDPDGSIGGATLADGYLYRMRSHG
ncbi:MAG: hypothetical protein ACPGQL_10340 [Thermoplasmatota archaeon]